MKSNPGFVRWVLNGVASCQVYPINRFPSRDPGPRALGRHPAPRTGSSGGRMSTRESGTHDRLLHGMNSYALESMIARSRSRGPRLANRRRKAHHSGRWPPCSRRPPEETMTDAPKTPKEDLDRLPEDRHKALRRPGLAEELHVALPDVRLRRRGAPRLVRTGVGEDGEESLDGEVVRPLPGSRGLPANPRIPGPSTVACGSSFPAS